MPELGSHLAYLNLVNSVFRDLIDDLVHLNKQLRPNGKFSDDFLLFPDIVAFVLAKKCTRGANTHPILYANDFYFTIVLFAHLHGETGFRHFWFSFLRGALLRFFCRGNLLL